MPALYVIGIPECVVHFGDYEIAYAAAEGAAGQRHGVGPVGAQAQNTEVGDQVGIFCYDLFRLFAHTFKLCKAFFHEHVRRIQNPWQVESCQLLRELGGQQLLYSDGRLLAFL